MTALASKLYGTVSPLQRVQAARHKLANHPVTRPYAGVMMVGDMTLIPRDDPAPFCRTACTNGRDEWYYEVFVNELTDAELRFLVLHEVMHKAYRHFITWIVLHKKCARTCNIACDEFINNTIIDMFAQYGDKEFVKMPEGGVLTREYAGMSAGEVFDIIYEEQQQGGTGSGDDDSDGGGSGGEQGNQGGSGDDDGAGLDDHDWEGAQALTAEEEADLSKEIDTALRQGAQLASRTGHGDQNDKLKELLAPVVNWKDVLREFVKTNCAGKDYSTWKRPNRRYRHYGIYLPTSISESIDSIVFGVDTSGSTYGFRQEMYSEIAHACKQVKPQKIHMAYWDTGVLAEEFDINDIDNIEDKMAPAGGGGTMVECLSDWRKENAIKPECIVIATDGYLGGSWGEWEGIPVLWLIINNKNCNPPVGQTVHITV